MLLFVYNVRIFPYREGCYDTKQQAESEWSVKEATYDDGHEDDTRQCAQY